MNSPSPQRIPSVSSLEETRPNSLAPFQKKKSRANKTRMGNARRVRADTEQRKRRDTASAVSRSGRWAVTEFAFAPTPAQKLLGRTPKRKMSFPYQKKITPAKIQRSKRHFFFLVLPSVARRWRGVRRAYDLISHHTARGACALPTLLFISQILKIGSNLVQ